MKLVDLLNEIKVKSPGGIIPVSLDTLKEAVLQDMVNTAEELEFEEPEEFIAEFKQELNKIQDNQYSFEKISKIYEALGFSEDQFYLVLKRLFIR
jgi:hypothetical protein